MTPREQAFKLRYYYAELLNLNTNDKLISECALITVDEIFKTNTLEHRNCGFVTLCEKHKEYWQEVKQEIEKI